MFQSPANAEALGENIASIEETIALCNMIVQDLLTIRRKVKVNCAPIYMNVVWLPDQLTTLCVYLQEKGLCDASFQEQTNQADFTLWSVF